MTDADAIPADTGETPSSQADKAARFLSLHGGPDPLLMPNPWDPGSARLLDWIGFEALATTSSGFASTLGRLDGSVSREEALAHAASIAAATDRPVSADLENCGRRPDARIYDAGLAAERVAAAAEVAHAGPVHFVLTARAENLIRGRPDLADTIARLQAYQEAGADVLFAPGLQDLEQVRQVVASVDRPVNVLAGLGGPTVAELGEVGVRRISVGGAFAFAALAGVVDAARELREQGTYGFRERSQIGLAAARDAFAETGEAGS